MFSPPRAEPRLTVCILTKDEERFLAQCLASIRPLAHQLVVLDTGSTDRTVALAREFGAEVYTAAWQDDFSAARNAALAQARGDWVLMLDADEELPPDQHAALRAALNDTGAIAFRLPIVNRGEEALGANYVPRLFRNVPGAAYRGRIHEQVFPSLIPLARAGGLEIKLGSARLLHHGYTAELVRDRRKVERNLRLLRLALAERPHDPNLRLNLGLELARSGELEAALPQYEQAFRQLSAAPAEDVAPELRETLLTQFATHLFKARRPAAVVETLTSPLARHGGLTASLHYALGLAHFEVKAFREAAEQMRQCLARLDEPAFTPVQPDIRSAAPHHCLALSLVQLGDLAAAEAAFRAGLAAPWTSEALALDYARFLARQQRPVEALELLHGLITAQPRLAGAWQLGGELALSRPDFLAFALDWTAEALKAVPNHVPVRAQRAEALLLSQQLEAAGTLWNQLADAEPLPRHVAARVLCALVEQPAALGQHPLAGEAAVSRALLDWHRRLVEFSAQETVEHLHHHAHRLAGCLPGAAQVLAALAREVDAEGRN